MCQIASIVKLVNQAQTVLFDMDGVVVLSEPVKFQAYQTAFAEQFGVTLPASEVGWIGKGEAEVVRFWLDRLGLRRDVDVTQMIERKRAVYSALVKAGQVCPIPGVIQFIRLLSTQGKRIGLVTGSNSLDQQTIFQSLAVKNLFSTVVTLDDVKRPKPYPDGYLLAVEKLQARPEDCLVFDDSPAGVEAAEAAGLPVVCVTTSHRPKDFPKNRFFISDFIELCRVLSDEAEPSRPGI